MMHARGLIAGWIMLVVLSAATATVTMSDLSGERRTLASAAVLVLAGLKARIILTRYLRLSRSRFWLHVFDGVIGSFLFLAYAIYTLTAKG